MKRAITKQEQERINELLKARKAKTVNKPQVNYSKQMDIERLLQYQHDNTIGQETGRCGLTYLDVEKINYNYNF